ncbi:4a-hydroxytetrahydrobiopterin dehydratase [Enterovibrio norvegicus]|uniref:Putative pterin-4-alpha-carbinolamine dehydratase n=1 Tax=Enterovibrio norvegicus TaxID=188144 RepID=A0ABV4KW46_9GAMM|nr:4a-hydroxytetrahydrobiopterin dehydratase [Enterovibrio norvegicus]MCC4798553.1 4a-hydroxytetrahydrobiopterin dehydratase [Enterovibrio norvegicus]OEE63164.1 4a-hydroxytetrahydrobiopterin dehydratase [Enterovibrio norvegicus]OEF57049.1 4a-hydroxytetrahydrobiopterin dehydratase [Enterovibrio norvegicus]PMH65430.1 4a-hydroxytetrahydrobiopterin dehydratase [Enterovibrio norvegicus]PMI33759.1 4a-hydroxytetrahydrobiopterin dehydratase [Enterovibrio norvegicus]
MTNLHELQCEACRADAPRVEQDEASTLQASIPDWELITVDGIDQLHREFTFKNFKLAWAFSNEVATLAEAEGHHPAILLEWGKVSVTWWTHKIKGLHKNDFICAAKTDALLR